MRSNQVIGHVNEKKNLPRKANFWCDGHGVGPQRIGDANAWGIGLIEGM